MLYVVAWPVLSEADDIALRRLRAQYHPSEAGLIGPHFTLVFGASDEREQALQALLAAASRRPFWFMIDRIVRVGRYLVAEPSDGAAELIELYEMLNPPGARAAFRPHITLGLFDREGRAEQVARIVERAHLPMRGRIEQLALLRRDGDRLVELQCRTLAA